MVKAADSPGDQHLRHAGPPPGAVPALAASRRKAAGRKAPARDRELLILRTAVLCQAEYEWGQHRLIGQSAGISEAEIDRVRNGAAAEGWDPFDAALLSAVEELHCRSPHLRRHLGDARRPL